MNKKLLIILLLLAAGLMLTSCRPLPSNSPAFSLPAQTSPTYTTGGSGGYSY